MISTLLKLIKHIAFSVLNCFIMPNKKIEKNTVLVIRLDAIGDYIVFRNFLKSIYHSNTHNKPNITLVANIAWKPIAEELDSEYIAHFIWLDRNKFVRHPIYRFKKLTEITRQGYELVLNPAYSREFFLSDAIVNMVVANKKIGNDGDLATMSSWQKKLSDRYYTKLITCNKEITFEFYRNKHFFNQVLSTNEDDIQPKIELKPRELNLNLPKKYAVLFIGASMAFRKWHLKNFAKVAQHLKQANDLDIVLCGGPADVEEAKEFQQHFTGNFHNLVGKTSLVELMYVIKDAELMLANETSGPHFAAALSVKNIFVISNGNHFGRFTPYPKEVYGNYHAIFPKVIEAEIHNTKWLLQNYGSGSTLNINEINAESVIARIDKVLIN